MRIYFITICAISMDTANAQCVLVTFGHEKFVILRNCQYTGAAQKDARFVSTSLRALPRQMRVLPVSHHSGT